MSRPSKRSALETLTKARLVELDQGFEIGTPQNHAKADFVEALASSKRASFEKVLELLSRDELKAICRAHDLDDGGRSKSPIVDRILGREEATEAPKTTATGSKSSKRGRSAGSSPAPEQIELPADGKLTVTELEKYLWSAADILRGSIDSSDYKSFIFGMLFLKRLSDRFEEEAQKLVDEGEDEEVAWNDPDEHQFFVPQKARWSGIQQTATNVGEALNRACAALEESNASLEGVLQGIDFNDPNRLGDTKNRDTVLGRLVQHFSKLNLRNDALSEPDMLGRAYEYLIERFADDAGKKGGEFYTPHKVVELIVELLQPKEGMRICDPTCGSGGMLVQCATYVQKHGGNNTNLTLHGQEKNLGTWGICKMNMLLHGRPSARIEKGDTIRDPKLLEDGELILYDRVIANPPFSLDEWGQEVAAADRYGRFRFGVPPKSKGDLAFIQHMAATIKEGGKVGVVMPHGVLFRGSTEGSIREGLLREDLFEAVIGLPPNLFYGTGIPAAVLVLSRKKANDRKGKVLFIDASGDFGQQQTQNCLRDADVKKISSAFHAYEDREKYARVVPLEEIEANDFNLNISRYVDTTEAEERIDLAGAIEKLRQAENARAVAEHKMNSFLKELGYGTP